jgi:hypothetical protein
MVEFSQIKVNHQKIKNVVEKVQFDKLQKKENEEGFFFNEWDRTKFFQERKGWRMEK